MGKDVVISQKTGLSISNELETVNLQEEVTALINRYLTDPNDETLEKIEYYILGNSEAFDKKFIKKFNEMRKNTLTNKMEEIINAKKEHFNKLLDYQKKKVELEGELFLKRMVEEENQALEELKKRKTQQLEKVLIKDGVDNTNEIAGYVVEKIAEFSYNIDELRYQILERYKNQIERYEKDKNNPELYKKIIQGINEQLDSQLETLKEHNNMLKEKLNIRVK